MVWSVTGIEAWLIGRQQRVCLDGAFTSWRQVWSGVLQGSVFGPVLFLVFINDLDSGLSSSVLKFADDTRLYRPVNNQMNGMSLQHDLNIVSNWAERWQMEFIVSKCKVLKVMHYGKKNIGYSYSMNGQLLEETDSEKDLGVVCSDNLKASAHCQEAYSKANRMLGLINRTIKYKNPEVLLNLYKSMVRPHLECCSTVWSPHYIKDKTLPERVQHRFTRLFPHLRSLPCEVRLSHLGLWTVEERRNTADLIEIFKIAKGLSSIPWSCFFHKAEGTVARGHSWKLAKRNCCCDTRLYFSQLVINRWNSLSQEDITTPSINSFKNRIEKDVLVRWTSLKTHGLQALSAAGELLIWRDPSDRQ